MSRIGQAPIAVPTGVDVSINGDVVTVKGKLGELTQELSGGITVSMEENIITVERPSDSKEHKAKHGLYRALINNMVQGVSIGWSHSLELVGVGYRASNQGQILDLSLGYSHNFLINIPAEVSVETALEKGKNPTIKFTSHDKQLVGAITAKVRSLRKPEPYKGKGVKFVGEQIRRKAGKSASKK
ncbi:MAG: 50S ribosomal protein L6 [Schleiferiaceae bacterium]|jgi:large subunit ribosomal protein L6|nr:50S ribosomal protein L6 [Schleiferiaceae bacterium]MDP4759182.1 50S ribosomal protein L6 [Schleiferiaceae bacterium]MDP4768205.1 50S ribosomal protein L6 [Schleiferiaceae bacterium]MDP4878159.1 50S ribosomal protein L6 [Schleiferiaceae bacterium]MDP4959541.1 50S ribosomal protein L6 [Schleiferiaceae bacterium]